MGICTAIRKCGQRMHVGCDRVADTNGFRLRQILSCLVLYSCAAASTDGFRVKNKRAERKVQIVLLQFCN
jgi:hypothetical protein